MSPQLQTMIKEAQELSPVEQVELIAAISQALQNKYKQLSRNNDFWNPKTLKQLSDEQRVQAVKSLSDLAADFWPEEESVDEFNEFIYKQRLEDRLSD
ncbi:MAG: hypothetical protein ACE5G1_16120, partial [bacterium]